MSTPRVTLITRAGCHLCEQALEVLRRVDADTGCGLLVLDYDEPNDHPSPGQWPARYTEQLPVVLVDGREHDHWRVDEHRLRRTLAAPAGRRSWWRALRPGR